MLMKPPRKHQVFLRNLSLYYAIQYVHEFFHNKNRRNIFRGHLSRYGNVLWSVPLRFILRWYVDNRERFEKSFSLWGIWINLEVI